LKLRAGLVRCGACKEIFNGVEHLLRPEEVQKPTVPPPSSAVPPAERITPAAPPPQNQDDIPGAAVQQESPLAPAGDSSPLDNTGLPESEHVIVDESHQAPLASRPPDYSPHAEDPLQRMTLMDFTAFEETPARPTVPTSSSNADSDSPSVPDARAETASYADSQDELSQAIDDLQRKPWRRAKTSSSRRSSRKSASARQKDPAEPAFVKHARWQKKYGRRIQVGMAIGALMLLAALALQSVYAFRNTIAVKIPQSRSYLIDFCNWFSCRLNLPAQIDKVSIESSELHSLPANPNQFTLSVLLNNQATTAQAWPDIELTLNDGNEKPIARKVFAPHDYLPPKDIAAGFSAESEKTVKVSFELLQLKASGYRVYLFYP
jgi:hypothetical protein